MALEDAKKAAALLKKKYEQSFYDYAAGGFAQTLAHCLHELPDSVREDVLGGYPAQLREKVLAALDELPADESGRAKRDVTYIISHSDLFEPEDYLALEESLYDLPLGDYEALKSDAAERCPWLEHKIALLANPLCNLTTFPYWRAQEIIGALPLKDLKAFYVCTDSTVRDLLFANISKNNLADLLREFALLPAPGADDLRMATKHLGEFLAQTR